VRLHPEQICIVSYDFEAFDQANNKLTMQPQPQPTSYQANLHPLHLRNRHHADPIRHGCRQRHHHPGEPSHVRLDINTPAQHSRNQSQLQRHTHTLRASHA
jgi:hypothetical protein